MTVPPRNLRKGWPRASLPPLLHIDERPAWPLSLPASRQLRLPSMLWPAPPLPSAIYNTEISKISSVVLRLLERPFSLPSSEMIMSREGILKYLKYFTMFIFTERVIFEMTFHRLEGLRLSFVSRRDTSAIALNYLVTYLSFSCSFIFYNMEINYNKVIFYTLY